MFVDKVVLIVGGVKNFGGLIVWDLVGYGVKVVVIYYNSVVLQVQVEEIVVVVCVVGVEVVMFQVDLMMVVVVEKLFDDVKQCFGKIDIVINMVGKVLKKLFIEISEVEYDEMFVVNSKLVFFFIKEVGWYFEDYGKFVMFVMLLFGVFMLFYVVYEGLKVLVEYFMCVVLKEYGVCGILVMVVGLGLMDMLFFYLVEGVDVVVYYKMVVVLLLFSKMGLIDIEDVVLFICYLVIEGWWIIGQMILINGGYMIK